MFVKRRRRGDVESFARTHVGVATTRYVANLDTRVELIGVADHRVPVTVNLAEWDNAWVCSPYTAYCAYVCPVASDRESRSEESPLFLELQRQTMRAFPTQRPVVTKLDLTRPYLEAWWSKTESGELPRTRSIEFML